MAQRKGLSAAQERLARLAGTARPVSQQQEAPPPPLSLEPEPSNTSEAKDEQGETIEAITATPDMASDVTGNDLQQEAGHVSDDVSSHAAGVVAGDVPSLVTQYNSSDVVSDVTDVLSSLDLSHGVAQDAGDIASHVTPTDVERFTVRVRGRWTLEQRAFIDRFRLGQQATAAEVLRHIVAWYLEQEPQPSTVNRGVLLSGQVLIKRETGLRVLDFMTTPGQAAAIKRAAGQLEEAAWLRKAVDVYRERGPLIGQGV